MVAWIDEVNEAVLNIPKPGRQRNIYHNQSSTKISENNSSSQTAQRETTDLKNSHYSQAQTALDRDSKSKLEKKFVYGRRIETPDNTLQLVQLVQSPRPGRKHGCKTIENQLGIDSVLENNDLFREAHILENHHARTNVLGRCFVRSNVLDNSSFELIHSADIDTRNTGHRKQSFMRKSFVVEHYRNEVVDSRKPLRIKVSNDSECEARHTDIR